MQIRTKLYQVGILKIHPKSKNLPVIVVGNISVGGTGKTPCVIHIVQLLKEHGYRPGIVSRGYKGTHHRHKCLVSAHSFTERSPYSNLGDVSWVDLSCKTALFADASFVGDEPLLMAKRLQCPVVVSRHRAKAVQALVESNLIDVIISDDGLQHYAMARDIEIALVDGLRRLGNGYCLPVGPLREPLSRLAKMDFTIVNLSEGGIPADNEYDMDYQLSDLLVSLEDFKSFGISLGIPVDLSTGSASLTSLKSSSTLVHAVAGLAQPTRFFNSLKNASINFVPHAFPDHHPYTEKDLNFADENPILITEKDAVKCLQFQNRALCRKIWVVNMNARISPLFDARLLLLLKEKVHG
jgi:tetraacyldisaccharide 4'-kinase